jgi:hypothetical protein
MEAYFVRSVLKFRQMEKSLDDGVSLTYAGYFASVWMIVFAVMSFYWAQR